MVGFVEDHGRGRGRRKGRERSLGGGAAGRENMRECEKFFSPAAAAGIYLFELNSR
jgi:hypothetical protein